MTKLFSWENFFGDDGSQNVFVYQPTLNMLELKKDKGNDYVLSCKSKGVYNSQLKPLYTTFLHSIKFSGIKFDKDPLSCRTKQLCYKNCKCLDCL